MVASCCISLVLLLDRRKVVSDNEATGIGSGNAEGAYLCCHKLRLYPLAISD